MQDKTKTDEVAEQKTIFVNSGKSNRSIIDTLKLVAIAGNIIIVMAYILKTVAHAAPTAPNQPINE